MTPQELKIYQISSEVMLLESVFSRILIGLLMKAGASIEQSREEIIHAIERDGKEIEAEIPALSQGDPAQNALLLEEFRETVEHLKSLINSYK